MPKPTFSNLPPEKRDALVAIALEEFATHDYNAASVSRIVARAGIAKGSLYQYFDDKEDLFLYLLDEAQRTLLGALQDDPPPDEAWSFFVILRWQMSATVRAALRYPLHARLAQHAYMAPLPFRNQMIEQGRELRKQHMQRLLEQGIAHGDINPAVNLAVAGFVVSAVIGEVGPFLLAILGLDASRTEPVDPAQFDSALVERLFDDIIRILEYGLGADTAP